MRSRIRDKKPYYGHCESIKKVSYLKKLLDKIFDVMVPKDMRKMWEDLNGGLSFDIIILVIGKWNMKHMVEISIHWRNIVLQQ